MEVTQLLNLVKEINNATDFNGDETDGYHAFKLIEKVDPYAINGEYRRYTLFLNKATTKIKEMQESKNTHEASVDVI